MTTFYLTFTDDSRTDREGRRQFFLDWKDGERVRGQCYFSRPDEVAARLVEHGHEVLRETAPWRRS